MSDFSFGDTDTEDAAVAEISGALKTDNTTRRTRYDELRAELTTPADRKSTLRLKVEGRPNLSIRFNTLLDYDRLQKWTDLCTNKKGKVDMRKLSLIILNSQCSGIFYKDVEMLDSEGEPLTFRHPEFRDMADALDPIGAITWTYGQDNDGEIMQVANAITEAAGYAEATLNDADDEGASSDPLG